MKKTYLLSIVIFTAAALTMTPEIAVAQGDSPVSTTVLNAGVFVTVKETVAGDVLSLYRVSGDRIILVDTVVNTGTRNSRDLKISDRYLHRLKVENK